MIPWTYIGMQWQLYTGLLYELLPMLSCSWICTEVRCSMQLCEMAVVSAACWVDLVSDAIFNYLKYFANNLSHDLVKLGLVGCQDWWRFELHVFWGCLIVLLLAVAQRIRFLGIGGISVLKINLVSVSIQFQIGNFYFSFSFSFEIISVTTSVLVLNYFQF